MGRFTIASSVPQFKEFADFVYFGNIVNGILWFKENALIAKEKTLIGQSYVDQYYSLKTVSKKWKDVL